MLLPRAIVTQYNYRFPQRRATLSMSASSADTRLGHNFDGGCEQCRSPLCSGLRRRSLDLQDSLVAIPSPRSCLYCRLRRIPYEGNRCTAIFLGRDAAKVENRLCESLLTKRHSSGAC